MRLMLVALAASLALAACQSSGAGGASSARADRCSIPGFTGRLEDIISEGAAASDIERLEAIAEGAANGAVVMEQTGERIACRFIALRAYLQLAELRNDPEASSRPDLALAGNQALAGAQTCRSATVREDADIAQCAFLDLHEKAVPAMQALDEIERAPRNPDAPEVEATPNASWERIGASMANFATFSDTFTAAAPPDPLGRGLAENLACRLFVAATPRLRWVPQDAAVKNAQFTAPYLRAMSQGAIRLGLAAPEACAADPAADACVRARAQAMENHCASLG